jgi:hypothetical protein
MAPATHRQDLAHLFRGALEAAAHVGGGLPALGQGVLDGALVLVRDVIQAHGNLFGGGVAPQGRWSSRAARVRRLIDSIMCTVGMLMVAAWSAMARLMACLIHQVA